MSPRASGAMLSASFLPVSILLMMLFLGLGCSRTQTPVLVKPDQPTPAPDGLSITGPYSSGNLAVWLVHGPDRSKGRNYLTVAEAVEQKKLIVHETGDVNQLLVENVSDDVVFIPAGSIVKGGRQDRTLGTDVIITRADGRMPIDSFCVEQGRWSQRGGESAAQFGSANAMVAGKEMKYYANANAIHGGSGSNQHNVWREVAENQQQLQQAVAGRTVEAAAIADLSVTSTDSPSSFQLTLETEAVKKLTERQRDELLPLPKGKRDVVGYVYAVNGEIVGGNVYASPALFGKLWPALLDSAIVEAVAEGAPTTQPSLPARDVVAARLATPADASASRQVNGRTTVRTYDVSDMVLLQTDDVEAGVPVSRTLLSKPDPTPGEQPGGLQQVDPQINDNNLPVQQQQQMPTHNAPATR